MFRACLWTWGYFFKSKIGGTGIDQLSLQQFATILNCDVRVTPFIYLGLSIGRCHNQGVSWSRVLDKVKARLSRWKGKCLSLAGRICLIKFVLSFVPLFVMSLFKMPSMVAEKIVRIQRDFLWEWGSKRRKIA